MHRLCVEVCKSAHTSRVATHKSFRCSSTQNTRIEKLWVEVGSQFVRRWRAFFTLLERLHRLNISNQAHLCLLHILFLDQIIDD